MNKRTHGWVMAVAMFVGIWNPPASLAEEPLPLNFIRAPKAVVVDGKLDEWVMTAPVSYEVDETSMDRSARTYAMWDDQNVYLAYQVRDASPMTNSGSDASSAFKTGDSLHFYFSADKDVAGKQAEGGLQDYHVLMTIQQGKPVIFAFRQQKAGADKPTQISSPAGKIEIAWMGPAPGAEMAVERWHDRQGPCYTAEVKLPLAFFDSFKPEAGLKVAADAAVNFSDSNGTKNVAKVWWSRGASQILDIPTELRFDRNLWGQGVFRAAGQAPVVTDSGNLFVVPAPPSMGSGQAGAVAIDGDLSDWDLSCAYGPNYVDPQLKDKFNITWVMMYDAQALYLGAVFNADGKFDNDAGVDLKWWLGDSIEFRMVMDPKNQTSDIRKNLDILTFALWYNAKEDKDYVGLQRSFGFETGDASSIAVKSKATQGGRTFEVRVPWTIVKSGSFPKAGNSVALTMAGIWKNGLRAYGMGSISSFRGVGDWGDARFLAAGKPPLVYLNLRRPAEVVAVEEAKYKAALDVPEKGLLSVGVYGRDGVRVRTLLAGKPVEPGKAEIVWNGNTDDGEAATPGKYQMRAVVNSGLKAQYVTSACNPGKPPYQSESPTYGWGGVWGNVIDIAADARGLYPLWSVEEGDGALLQIDDDGNLQWRQHIPLALGGSQVAVASNGKYVFVGVDAAGNNAGKAGLWRARCEGGAYVPFVHEGSDPLEFYLEGVTRPVPEKGKENTVIPPAISSLAADDKTLYVSAFHQNKVVCFDPETGKPGRSFDVEKPMGLCLDGKDGLVVISGTRVIRLDPASGKVEPLVGAGLDAPHDVACDKDGTILVTDRGASQQVKRFDVAGKVLGAFGQAGGRSNNGKYDVDKLLNPAGVVVSTSGKVFFSEDAAPKVIVRLSAELKYEKLWAGPWYMSGQVCVDPYQPEHLYHSCEGYVRFVIDYDKKTSAPDAVWSRFALPNTACSSPRIVEHKGVRYLLASDHRGTCLYRLDGYTMLLVAAVGSDRLPNGNLGPRWAFSDLNENGKLDEGEKVVIAQDTKTPPYLSHAYWHGGVDDRDMTLYLLSDMYGESPTAWALTPTFAKAGVPVYDLTAPRVIPLKNLRRPGKRSSPSSIWPAPDGGVFGNADANGSDPRGIGHSSHLSDVFVYRLDRDGKLMWRAGKKASGIAKNGEFYGRACGMSGPIDGKYFSFVDENGQDKVYTDDGLFVGNLLEDTATATAGENTLFVEHFGSVAYQNAKDKKWYFVAGAGGYASIWEIGGLDKIKRLTAEVDVK